MKEKIRVKISSFLEFEAISIVFTIFALAAYMLFTKNDVCGVLVLLSVTKAAICVTGLVALDFLDDKI